ncbi:MAG: iron-siderophore ABC transporter substrate-binding protein [Ilumatobacteraceae bacterium]
MQRSNRGLRRLTRTAVVVLLAVGAVACSSNEDTRGTPATTQAPTTTAPPTAPATAPAAAFPVTIAHAFGETTIEQEPHRIVALGDGSQDVVAALGLTPVGIPTGYPGSNADGVLPWYASSFDAATTTLLPVFDGIPFEQIAALHPDVILAPYAGFDESDYKTLSAIAPTVAYPGDPWVTPWPTQTRMIGEALGRSAEADALIAGVDTTLAGAAAAHPELAGLTFAYLYTDATSAWVFLPADARVELVSDLGLRPSDMVIALSADNPGAFTVELSPERLADIDADVLIVEQSDGPADISRVALADRIPAVQRGAVVVYGTEDAALSVALIPTVLSIPYAAQRLATDLAAALARATPTAATPTTAG